MRLLRLGLKAILLLSLFIPGFFTGTALADSSPLDVRGNGLAPLQNDEVEMVAERVDIYPYVDWVYTEATFTLRNTGPATTLLVGFPEEEEIDIGFPGVKESQNIITPHPLIDFTAEIDGTPATITVRPASPEQFKDFWRIASWHTFNVPFDAGQTRIVRNTYFQDVGSTDIQGFQYILQTGAAWKGTIGTADIIIHPSGGFDLDDFLVWHRQRDLVDWSIEPSDKIGEEKVIAWHFNSLEPGPEDNIHVALNWYHPPYSASLPGPTWFSVHQDLSGVSPDDVVTYQINAYDLAKGSVPNGTHISFYAGRERKKLAEIAPLSFEDYWNQEKFTGEFTIPEDLQPTYGRAVEVWAELENGMGKSGSAFIFLKDPPARAASAGSPPATPIYISVILFGLVLTALSIVTLRAEKNLRN